MIFRSFAGRQYGDPVTDAEGMVGNDHDRVFRSVVDRPVAPDVELDVDEIQHLSEHPIARADDVSTPEVAQRDVAIIPVG